MTMNELEEQFGKDVGEQICENCFHELLDHSGGDEGGCWSGDGCTCPHFYGLSNSDQVNTTGIDGYF